MDSHKIEKLNNEIKKLKAKNSNMDDNKSHRSFNNTSMYSKDLSRNSDISNDLVDKAVKMENKLKRERYKYSKLNKEFLESLDYYKMQGDVLYSMILTNLREFSF